MLQMGIVGPIVQMCTIMTYCWAAVQSVCNLRSAFPQPSSGANSAVTSFAPKIEQGVNWVWSPGIT